MLRAVCTFVVAMIIGSVSIAETVYLKLEHVLNCRSMEDAERFGTAFTRSANSGWMQYWVENGMSRVRSKAQSCYYVWAVYGTLIRKGSDENVYEIRSLRTDLEDTSFPNQYFVEVHEPPLVLDRTRAVPAEQSRKRFLPLAAR
jgi:hypothetical protein